MEVDVYDPWADPAEVKHIYGIKTINEYPSERLLSLSKYGAIILAVSHQEFLSINMHEHQKSGSIIYDVKGILKPELTDGRL